MFTGHNTDELDNLSSAEIRAPGYSREHAIDTWEDEGGGPAGPIQRLHLAQSALADNAGWRASNSIGWRADHPLHGAPKATGAVGIALSITEDDEEDRILRCLGAAVITRWNTIPTKLQRELFENASSMGELLQTDLLKGQIARFLHKHKDDAA